jgi:hypothetical protein
MKLNFYAFSITSSHAKILYEWLLQIFFWTVVTVLYKAKHLGNIDIFLKYLQVTAHINSDPFF